jgi:cytochrome c peroxidase
MSVVWKRSKNPKRRINSGKLFFRANGGGALLVAFLSACCIALTACHERRQTANAEQGGRLSLPSQDGEEIPLSVRIYFRPLPEKMPGSENDTPEMVELGRKLFFERGVSLTKSQSCSECHRLDRQRAGDDHKPTSLGAKGEAGTRNSPTVLNAGFQRMQFWDGRAADLVEQAKGPLLNPIEMAMRSEEDVVNQLKNSQDYCRWFEQAFPNQQEPVTFDNVAIAIAAFERTLITPARFDRYLKGDTDALAIEEKHGLHRFEHTGCVECHSSVPIGGRLLKKVGIYHPYQNQSDLGRFKITKNEDDKFVFKVGMLRNVTLTYPYFHDGRVATLQEAIWLMAWMQLDTELTPDEIDEVVCFLKTLEAEHLPNINEP